MEKIEKVTWDSNDELINLQKIIKQEWSVMFVEIFNEIFKEVNEQDKVYFNIENIKNLINWMEFTMYINVMKKQKGEISTNSILKFHHLIFMQPEKLGSLLISSEKYDAYKTEFIDNFNSRYADLINIKKNNEVILKYVWRNGYINVFLTDKYKDLIKREEENKKDMAENWNETQKFSIESIGYWESCFPEKFSIPRQGNLLDLTRGKIVINKTIDMAAFDGLDSFTYIWVVYIFHLHQNFTNAKISPPKYENGKLGVYATRTPHRQNSIGWTLCKLNKIVNNEIFISCIDMVSGTPIVDIKPYHHLESVDINQPGIKYAEWIKNADNAEKVKVTISKEAEENWDEIWKTKELCFYTRKDEIVPLIKGVWEIDPHSKYTKKKKETLWYAFHWDKWNVIYSYNPKEKEILVHEIQFSEEYKKLRNKEWTENYLNSK